MKLSLSWLAEFVDLAGLEPEAVAELLTQRTALVEGIERRGHGFEGVVVGRVLERQRHPNADRLALCTVGVGGETLQIVCGAPNVAAGQTVPVALPGALLPGDFRIKRSKIRGVESNGMICSPKELGLGEDHDGILVLEEGLELGRPFVEVEGVRDAVFEIDNKSITHRPDLWGHEGFGRELAAILDREFRPAEVDATLRAAVAGDGVVDVEIEAPDLCGRYAALRLHGPLGGRSPGLLRRRLEACGLRSLNLGADLTNYLMLDIGQPTHAFDHERLRGGAIRVRRSRAGERLLLLDGSTKELPAGLCVIADLEGPVAVAGVMGGEESGTGEGTREAVLESAFFDPAAVRASAAALGLRTEASARFEKHLDPALAERGARRFAALARRFASELRVEPAFRLAGERLQAPRELVLRGARARLKLGLELQPAEMAGRLRRLGFGAAVRGDDVDVVVPPHRATRDVLAEDDLIEEVGRLAGYDRIAPALPAVACAPVALEPSLAAGRRASLLLRERFGFAEALSYAFLDDAQAARAKERFDLPHVRLKNPLQQNAARLRRSLLPALLEFVDRNVRVVEDVRLFEIGRVFLPESGSDGLPGEPLVLAGVMAERTTRREESGTLLRRLKGVAEELARALERRVEGARFEGDLPGFAHPGRVARLEARGRPVGVIAQVHPDVAHAFGWRGEAAAFELDLEALLAAEPVPAAYAPPARYPESRVDVSFVCGFDVPYREWRDGLVERGTLLRAVELVDEYRGGGLQSGERSLTLRLVFRSDERTLEDAEVLAEVQRLKAWLIERGAALRS